MKCDIQPRTIYEINLDGESIGTIEKALAYYRDRAILPDDSPAAELSRTFTALLMKLKTGEHGTDKPTLPQIPGPEDEEVPEALPEALPEAPDEEVDPDVVDIPSEVVDVEVAPEEDEEEFLSPEVEPLDSDAEEHYCARCGRNPVNVVGGQNICEVCKENS